LAFFQPNRIGREEGPMVSVLCQTLGVLYLSIPRKYNMYAIKNKNKIKPMGDP
jgi:hypothetical protein